MRWKNKSLMTYLFLLLSILIINNLFVFQRIYSKDEPFKVVCPTPRPQVPKVLRSEVYKSRPFSSGEEAKYELKYGAVQALVGYGFLRVKPPTKHEVIVKNENGELKKEKRYHMVFQAEGYTGEWYKLIFVAHDKIQAISRSWDFGITKFYISQNESKPFAREHREEKWLEFEHFNCKVKTKEKNYTKKREKAEEFDLQYGAVDALGAIYKIRTLDYKVGHPLRFMVYTNEKNWWLEADPLKEETVKVKAGSFKAMKLKLRTYLGKDLQQKGNLYAWVAIDHPNKPLVKIEGEVTFGSIYLLLDSFKPGRS